jgi:molecular chaperone DnaK
MMAKSVIGIDLGTTNSCVATMTKNGTKVIPIRSGRNTMPSVVALDKTGQMIYGEAAKRLMAINPKTVIFETKRLVGRKFKDVKNLRATLPFDIVEHTNGDAWIKLDEKTYSPSQVAAFVLQKLKEDAETYLGHEITEAVITVPAYFDDAQRQATKDAGKIAGLNVLRIINEPTAAALAYGLEKGKSGNVAVFDLGGGTFDVSILHISDGVFEVKSTNGDTMLGGSNFDEAIMRWIMSELKTNIENDKGAIQRIKEAAERAKIDLSTTASTEINIPFLAQGNDGPIHLNTTLSRAQLENLTKNLIDKTIPPCEQALKDAKLTIKDIDDVVLVGGMTRMPKIVEIVTNFFGRKPHQGVNPDEVVAVGAAIQGAILAGDTSEVLKDVVLLDVTPLTLGIETMGGVMSPVIERNTTIPTKKSQIFSTAENNQTLVQIRVFQGERTIAAQNKLLGEFNLDGIPPAPKNVPQIEVTFDMDSDGILHVTAKDKGTGKEHFIRIASTGGLSKEEIQKMVDEAALHAEADKQLRELIEKRNQADSLIFSTESSLEEHGSKISEEEQSKIKESLERLKQVKTSDDINILTNAINDLSKVSMKLGEAVYKTQQEKQQNTQQNQNTDDKDDIVDV